MDNNEPGHKPGYDDDRDDRTVGDNNEDKMEDEIASNNEQYGEVDNYANDGVEEVDNGDVAIENRADKIATPDQIGHESNDIQQQGYITRYRRLSKPYDFSKYFGKTGTFYKDGEVKFCARPYARDSKLLEERIREGVAYGSSYFKKDVSAECIEENDHADKIKKFKDSREYEVYREAMQWCGYQPGEIEGLCMKVEQMSVQKGIRRYGEKGKSRL